MSKGKHLTMEQKKWKRDSTGKVLSVASANLRTMAPKPS